MSVTASSLSADSTYDDQGLFFSLLLGSCLLLVLGGSMIFAYSTSILWLKRFYRPNHTVEPLPRAEAEAAGMAFGGSSRGSSPRAGCDGREYPSPRSPVSPHMAEHRVRRGSRSYIRRKRLGESLPLKSAMFVCPTLKDWISIEEPSLGTRVAGALSPSHYTQQHRLPQHAMTRSFIPLTPTIAAYLQGVGGTPSYGATAPAHPMSPTGASEDDESRCQGPSSVPTVPPATVYPRTPLDPQVAVYLFTLKFFFTMTALGSLFTVWIMYLASQDDYMERSLMTRDIHGCGKHDDNETGCNLMKPFCVYNGLALGCSAVPLHGLYDLTVSNIHPRSWRWGNVAILNFCFCGIAMGLIYFFVQRVGAYAAAVTENQLEHALGYRVACVRGVGTSSIVDEAQFQRDYLTLQSYFPDSAEAEMERRRANDAAHVFTDGPDTSPEPAPLSNTVVSASSEWSDDGIIICQLPCTGCLFATAGLHHFVARPSNAIFAHPGMVKEVLLTRRPPQGMTAAIAAAEDAMASLQEAIADEKALHRKEALSGHGGVPAPLLTCAPYPSCWDKIPAVPYYEAKFHKAADKLNDCIDAVPAQRAAGAAFVVFANYHAAFEFMTLFNAKHGGVFSSLSATMAGPPGRIFQNSLTSNSTMLFLRFVLIFCLYTALILMWTIPVGILGSLESLMELSAMKKVFNGSYADLSEGTRRILNAYLPVVTLALFNVLLPHIMRFMVLAMGAFNVKECDGGRLYLQYIFMILTAVVFQAALQGGLSQLADLLTTPDEEGIINFFVSCVTPSSGYWYAKVIMATTLSTWMDLLDPIGLIKVVLLRGHAHIQRNYDALFLPCEFDFPRLYSFDLMILSMGILFHMTAPLLTLLVSLFFLMRYITQRAKLLDRYRPNLSPARDCTDFGISTQVIRCVMWQFCLAETGGVLLMSLRNHRLGVLLSALTLSASIVMLGYVYKATSKWPTTLKNARHLARRQAEQGLARAAMEASAPSLTTPLRAPRSPSPPEPVPGGHASPDNDDDDELFERVHVDNPSRRQRNADATAAAAQEEVAREGYETGPANLMAFLDPTSRNPFISHLLPRKPQRELRYQPKHQRLARLEAEAEVRLMKETEFVVERYWDRNMTWFEEDVDAVPSSAPMTGTHGSGREGIEEACLPKRRHQCGSVTIENLSPDVEPVRAHLQMEDERQTSVESADLPPG